MFRDGQGQIKKAVSTIGRQTDGDTFVFGPTVQLSSIGDIIPDSAWEYIWVPRIVEQGSVIPLACGIEDIPQCRSPLRHLLQGLKLLTQENYVSGEFVLGMLSLNLRDSAITDPVTQREICMSQTVLVVHEIYFSLAIPSLKQLVKGGGGGGEKKQKFKNYY